MLLIRVWFTGFTSWLYTPPIQTQGEAQQRVAAGTIPIGRGIHNSRLYVLDPSLQPVPIGVPGQLFISGVQVASCYLNRKDLTDEVFLANPFCEGPGTHTDRMYRTGDLAAWTACLYRVPGACGPPGESMHADLDRAPGRFQHMQLLLG